MKTRMFRMLALLVGMLCTSAVRAQEPELPPSLTLESSEPAPVVEPASPAPAPAPASSGNEHSVMRGGSSRRPVVPPLAAPRPAASQSALPQSLPAQPSDDHGLNVPTGEASDVHPSSGVATALPVISVETQGPPEVNVGKVAKFTITAANLGDTIARGAFVEVTLPTNAKFVGSNPPAEPNANHRIRMSVGDLRPKEKQMLFLEVIPKSRGGIELGTKIAFAALTKLAVQVKQPELSISASTPDAAMYGNTVTFKVVVRNIGDGPAEDVNVSQVFSDGLVAAKGGKSQNQVGWLMPGETREIYLSAVAQNTGILDAEFQATGAGGLESKTRTQITVRRPVVEVDATGPTISYLKRDGIYAVLLTNPGDAAATNVVTHISVAHGLQVTAVDRPVQFERASNMIRWRLDRVAPGGSEVLRFKANAQREGELVTEIVVNADAGLAADAKLNTEVISRADLSLQLADTAGPIEVGETAQFDIVVKNRGTKSARNVTVRVMLPESLDAIESGDYHVKGSILEFPAITLSEGEDKTLHFQAVGSTAGDHIVKAVLRCEALTREISVEESIFFFESQGRRVANRPGR